MLQRLARTMYRRRRYVLLGWIVLLVATFMLASSVGGAFKTEFKLPGTESQAAFDLLEKSSFRNRQIQAQIVFGSHDGIDHARDPGGDGRSSSPRSRRRSPTSTSRAPTPRKARGRSRATGRSRMRRSTSPTGPGEELTEAGKEIKQFAEDIEVPGLTIEFGGDVFADPEVGGASEAIGIAAAMVILLIAFGSVLAMGLPIGTALFGIGTGVAIVLTRAHRRRHARLHDRGGGDGRPRCRHRLRAVHRHAIPREPCRRARSRAQRGRAPSTPPGARCSSRVPPS